MNNPFSMSINTQQAGQIEAKGFSINDLSEVGIFLDSLETLGPGSTFSNVVATLGRSREMVVRYRNTVRAVVTNFTQIQSPNGGL